MGVAYGTYEDPRDQSGRELQRGVLTADFRTLERTIRSVSPDAIVAPYLVVVVTDARYYSRLSRNVFRFLPLRLTSRDLDRMHGIDERIGIREYEGAIRTYRQLILNVTGRSQVRTGTLATTAWIDSATTPMARRGS